MPPLGHCPNYRHGCSCPMCLAMYIRRHANSETYAYAPGQHAAMWPNPVDEAEQILNSP